jgi:hypothetical protein
VGGFDNDCLGFATVDDLDFVGLALCPDDCPGLAVKAWVEATFRNGWIDLQMDTLVDLVLFDSTLGWGRTAVSGLVFEFVACSFERAV